MSAPGLPVQACAQASPRGENLLHINDALNQISGSPSTHCSAMKTPG